MMGNLLSGGLRPRMWRVLVRPLRPPMWREQWRWRPESFFLPVSEVLVYGVFRCDLQPGFRE